MLKAILKRRSIRAFKDEKVQEETIKEILKAAMLAPTARNTQTWKFTVIENRDVLNSLAAAQKAMGMMKTAAFAIVVSGDRDILNDEAYLYVHSGAAIENMLLEAYEEGLGTCWCAVGPIKERMDLIKETLKLPDNLLPVGIVAFGVADEVKEDVDRYDPDKVSWVK